MLPFPFVDKLAKTVKRVSRPTHFFFVFRIAKSFSGSQPFWVARCEGKGLTFFSYRTKKAKGLRPVPTGEKILSSLLSTVCDDAAVYITRAVAQAACPCALGRLPAKSSLIRSV
jgi:hypothetical protein